MCSAIDLILPGRRGRKHSTTEPCSMLTVQWRSTMGTFTGDRVPKWQPLFSSADLSLREHYRRRANDEGSL